MSCIRDLISFVRDAPTTSLLSFTPMKILPPAVLAKATISFARADEKELLNSMNVPSPSCNICSNRIFFMEKFSVMVNNSGCDYFIVSLLYRSPGLIKFVFFAVYPAFR
jgi:DNA-directed RNA polymerase subunit RPC12/RpoP